MKKSILFLMICVVACVASAEMRTMEQMQQIARDILGQPQHSGNIHRMPAEDNHMQILRETDNMAFVGYADGGFVVISKDEKNEAILGYSRDAVMNEILPDGLQWWIKAMDAALTINSTKSAMRKSPRRAPKKVIHPLISTKWGQQAPYNNLLKYTLDGTEYQFVTGCVATAMSQVIKFYEYPVQGVGSHQYYIKYGNVTDTLWLESDFSAHTYDYANMLDEYDHSETEAQKTAVATLMKDCGIAVDMQYNGIASGTTSDNIPGALKTYFDYDDTVRICKRSQQYYMYMGGWVLDTVYNYTDEEWKQLIVDELEACRPIIYSGCDKTSGGHAFVVDGLDEKGLVHVNWGWEGYLDGYFDIDLLNPHEDSYAYLQDAVINIIPKDPQFIPTYYTLSLSVQDSTAGSVTGGGTYKADSKVTINATPENGYEFDRWSDNNTDNPRTITLVQDISLTASFKQSKKERFDNITDSATPTKLIRDGQVFILRGEKTYTLQGQEIR